jgi:dTDP-4-amino-4,6-dideoxygalactose transaminase
MRMSADIAIPHSRPQLGDGERRAVLATLDRSWVGAGGPASTELENALAAAFGRPAALATSSGSAALEVALRGADVAGELVAIPAFACASIGRAVVRAAGRPYLVDADPDDLSFPPGTLGSLAGRCKAAILVHQFGLPATSALEVANVPMTVIEDVTTCAGGRVLGRAVGGFGHFVVVSFSATKMLCGGEGGAVLGSVADIEAARRWIDPESDLPPAAPVPHAKMADIACALARVQLARLPEFVARRAEIARRYDEALGEQAHRVLRAPDGRSGTWWRYLMAVPGEAARAVANGRASGVCFSQPVPIRLWPGRGDFPVSDRMHGSLVSVPIYPALTDAEIERVLQALREVVRVA